MRSITAIGAFLMTSGLLMVSPSYLVLADGPKEGTVLGAPESASSTMTPSVQDEQKAPAEAGDIQERGVFPGRLAPGLVAPNATLQVPAPTPSLTAIRSAMTVTSKSVSVNLRIPPNLPVTVPIEVEVFYSSPFRSQILKRTYNPAAGLTLLYRDVEGNGQPRPMNVQITVRELVPNGQVTGFHKAFTITPLYDVFITDLRFVMARRCDTVGKSDITFLWRSPEGQIHEQKFKLGEGEAKGITGFNWTRKEISTRDNLREPSVYFDERDPIFADYSPPIDRSDTALVPGPTTKYHFFLKEETTGPPGRPRNSGSGCEAEITYTIIRAVMPFDQF